MSGEIINLTGAVSQNAIELDASVGAVTQIETTGIVAVKGDTGNAATIAIGTVTTVGPDDAAAVTNSGTSNAAIFDFDIPQGETGEGVVVGGSPGQVLSKIDGTDFNTEWTTPFSGDYNDLSDLPTLGTAAAADTGDFAPALGTDDNYVTNAEKANLHAPHSDDQVGDGVTITGAGTIDDPFVSNCIPSSGYMLALTYDPAGGAEQVAFASDLTAKVSKSGDTMSGTLNTYDLIPVTTATYTLGDSTHYFSSLNATTINLNGTASLSGGTAGSIGITGLVGIGTTAPTHTLTLPSTATGIALYNTADQTTNYERVRQYWSGGIFYINTERGGTGNLRYMCIGTSTSYLKTPSGTNYGFQINMGSSGVADNYALTILYTLVASSGVQYVSKIAPTINQSGTAGYIANYIDVTETATGSGEKSLANWKVGGDTKFKVGNDGATTLANTLTVNTSTNLPLDLYSSNGSVYSRVSCSANGSTSNYIFQDVKLKNSAGFYETAFSIKTNFFDITAGNEYSSVYFYNRYNGTQQTMFNFYGQNIYMYATSTIFADGKNIGFGATTGTKIGTATSQKFAFHGSTPTVQDTGWAVTNVTTDRTFDANSTTLDEVSDVLGTLINKLIEKGLIGA